MSQSSADGPAWDIPAARNLYNIQRWGSKYFDINEAGRVVVSPLQEAGAGVDINDVIDEARGRGLKFPLLIRFQDILRHSERVRSGSLRSPLSEMLLEAALQNLVRRGGSTWGWGGPPGGGWVPNGSAWISGGAYTAIRPGLPQGPPGRQVALNFKLKCPV